MDGGDRDGLQQIGEFGLFLYGPVNSEPGRNTGQGVNWTEQSGWVSRENVAEGGVEGIDG